MFAGYFFYGVALFLIIYIIVDLVRTRRFDISDAIAVLGVVISIIIALPTPLPNVFGLAEAKVVFDENFDDGVVNGIQIFGTDWEMINLDKTDKALRINNISNTEWGHIEFADQPITNGTMEYSVNLISYDNSLGICPGCIALHFRSTSEARYVFAIAASQSLSLQYQGSETNEEWVPLGKATSAYNLSLNTWHQVKITCIGSDITVNFDGAKVLSANDDRLNTGSINIGIAPSTIVQFDDLRISTQP
jgi:hypothetical protein